MLWLFLSVVLIAEIYYWFVYFPRAWRDRSNREINDIRTFTEYLRSK